VRIYYSRPGEKPLAQARIAENSHLLLRELLLELEVSRLGENSRKLPFASARVVAQAKILAQARAVLLKR